MKVIFFASDNNLYSGAFLSMVSLIKILRNKYQVEPLIVLPNDGQGKKLLEQNQISYVIVKSYTWTYPFNQKFKNLLRVIYGIFINFIAIPKIKRIIGNYNPDFVHINTSWTCVGAIAAMQKKIPVIWHIREYLEEDQNRKFWNRKYSYRIINKASMVIAISKDLYCKYSKVIDKHKLTIVYNGLDVDKYYDKYKEIFTSENNNRFIIVGNLNINKGHVEVIKALKIVKNRGYNFSLHIIGVGNEEKKLKKLVRKLDLEREISFEGFQSNTPFYYKNSDVMFMASKCEAFGRVTVEAMLGGVLVIGSRSGATPEILENNFGYLFEPGDSNDLAEKIIYVLEHKEEARKVMNDGRQMALEKFSSDKNVSQIYEIYKYLLNS